MKKLYEETKKIIERISEKSRISKKMLLPAFLLLAGILALTVSEISAQSKAASVQTTVGSTAGTGEYAADLEMRLTSIISSISGAGKTKVMVTLESGSEEIYLHDYNYGENADPSGKNSFERKDEYVIVDSEGGEKGIVVRVAEPRVRGVAVVCEGGNSEVVREQIISAVTALLDISSAKVSVAKMN